MIHLVIPFMPPSTNHAYENKPALATIRGRPKPVVRRVPSAAHKVFKAEVRTHLGRQYPQEMKFFSKNVPYALFLLFLFGKDTPLVNKGYPARADLRYKKLDVTNRIKLLEDVLAEVAVIDDSQFQVVAAKKAAAQEDAVHVWAWNMDEEQGPFAHAAESVASISGVQ